MPWWSKHCHSTVNRPSTSSQPKSLVASLLRTQPEDKAQTMKS
jgi:hypothetical protein